MSGPLPPQPLPKLAAANAPNPSTDAHDYQYRVAESTHVATKSHSHVSVFAGKRAPKASLVNVAKLVTAYYSETP